MSITVRMNHDGIRRQSDTASPCPADIRAAVACAILTVPLEADPTLRRTCHEVLSGFQPSAVPAVAAVVRADSEIIASRIARTAGELTMERR